MNNKEMIIWIDSDYKINGTNAEFSYNIGNVPYNNKLINVELLKAYIAYNFVNEGTEFEPYYSRISFLSSLIKIYIDFGVGSNYRYNTNGILMGTILTNSFNFNYLDDNTYNGYVSPNKSGEELIGDPIMYSLNEQPNTNVNVKITNSSDSALVDKDGDVPRRVLLCLKFTY